jgi:hypothetical protein
MRETSIHGIEPGAGNYFKPIETRSAESEPPEGFIDSTVYRYKLDEDGNKVLIGTMDAFPEGWDHPQQFREKGFQKKKEEVKEMPKKDIDFEAIVARAQEVAAERGISLYKASGIVAQETGLHRTTVYNRAKAMEQTPTPEPAEAANQEPERESQEPAGDSVAQGAPFDEAAFNPDKPEITVKDVLMCEAAQREQGFGPEDEEPIPYVPVSLEKMVIELREDLDLERKKVAALEKKMELLASALPAGSRTSQENRLAKLLVAVFRELGDAGTA